MPTSEPDPSVSLHIRPALPEDLPGIAEILNREIREGFAHFGTEPISLEEVERDFSHSGNLPWFAAVDGERLLAFARANAWKARGGYRYTCEIGVYVCPEAQGMGIGARVYEVLIPELQTRGFKTVLAGIALPNPASVRLHERFGFQPIGVFPKTGWKGGAWRDVGYWALTFERPDPI